MGKFRVYVYAICKNERAFAARWMQSMREADGVYVLDTGSTDGTPEALTELGAQVTCEEITPWRFDKARNRSLALVPENADICVCTDLDEYFTPGWREQVESAWAEGAQQLRYPYVWSFNADGREGVFFYADKMHARQGFAWIHPVHEVLRSTDGSEPQRALCQGMRLEHHPDTQKSRAQYLPLLELAVQETPQDDRSMHYLGREYLFHGRWTDCIATLKRHLSLPSATWRDERCASMRYIARAYAARGNAGEQESYLLRAAGEASYLREPWLELARMYYGRQNWQGTAYACERALQITDRPRTYMTEAESFGALPWDLLSIACYQLGQYSRAAQAAQEALRFAPQDVRIAENVRLMREKAEGSAYCSSGDCDTV